MYHLYGNSCVSYVHAFLCCIYYVAYNQVTWLPSVSEKAHVTLLVDEVNSHSRAHILGLNSNHPETGRTNPNSHSKQTSPGQAQLPDCSRALFGRLRADTGQTWASDRANSWMVRMSLKNNLAQALNCSVCLNEHHISRANGNKAQHHAIAARLEDTAELILSICSRTELLLTTLLLHLKLHWSHEALATTKCQSISFSKSLKG